MRDTQNEQLSGQIITIYAPIFREKLKRLERRGKTDCVEAIRLRKTLAQIDEVMLGPRLPDGDLAACRQPRMGG